MRKILVTGVGIFVSVMALNGPTVASDPPIFSNKVAMLAQQKLPKLTPILHPIACPSSEPCCCATLSGGATAQCMTKDDCTNVVGGQCIKSSGRC